MTAKEIADEAHDVWSETWNTTCDKHRCADCQMFRGFGVDCMIMRMENLATEAQKFAESEKPIPEGMIAVDRGMFNETYDELGVCKHRLEKLTRSRRGMRKQISDLNAIVAAYRSRDAWAKDAPVVKEVKDKPLSERLSGELQHVCSETEFCVNCPFLLGRDITAMHGCALNGIIDVVRAVEG